MRSVDPIRTFPQIESPSAQLRAFCACIALRVLDKSGQKFPPRSYEQIEVSEFLFPLLDDPASGGGVGCVGRVADDLVPGLRSTDHSFNGAGHGRYRDLANGVG